MAVSTGAEILERHVGIDDINPLNKYSLDKIQLDKWVSSSKEAKQILGFEDKKILTKLETNSIKELARGVYCKTWSFISLIQFSGDK